MMKKIRVITNARKQEIREEEEEIIIKVKAKPVRNQANKEVISMLAEYLGVKEKQIRIIKGIKSRNKEIEIRDEN